MTDKECSCWKLLKCTGSEECPDKCESGKTCWEISFLHNNWEKVFEKCKKCKVFQNSITESDNLKLTQTKKHLLVLKTHSELTERG
jgi:hypothetical protein